MEMLKSWCKYDEINFIIWYDGNDEMLVSFILDEHEIFVNPLNEWIELSSHEEGKAIDFVMSQIKSTTVKELIFNYYKEYNYKKERLKKCSN